MVHRFFAPPGIVRRIAHLPAFLQGAVVDHADDATHLAGWGYRPSGKRAARLARRTNRPMVYLEDGLLATSPGLPVTHRMSLAVDSRAPYFDTRVSTDLEELILGTPQAQPSAAALRAQWAELGVGKYASGVHGALPETIALARTRNRPVVLLLDQLAGDASLEPGLAGPDPWGRMLEHAARTFPDALLVLKPHPRAGKRGARLFKRRGAFPGVSHPNLWRCPQSVPLATLLTACDHVYTVTSQAGFEALLAGKPVTCVGHPWYAGWGLTTDLHVPARRAQLPARSLDAVFEAAMMRYLRYVHPSTGAPISLAEALAHLALQLQVARSTPRQVAIVDAQLWKKPFYEDFFQCSQVSYVTQDEVSRLRPSGTALVTWGQRTPQGVVDRWRSEGYTVLQAEDGFLRSVGLGCELTRPVSMSFDAEGLYSDPRTQSSLVREVQEPLSGAQEREAQQLLRLHNSLKLSKYLGSSSGETVHWRTADRLSRNDAQVLLICGQVADDISVKSGACPFASFEALVNHLRRTNPEALIIYRPHPDVVKGLRPGEMQVSAADVNDPFSSTRLLTESADEVHVINSLAGFEALMAGRKVVTWGLAWYAGWGLTEDRVQPARATRASLLQLVHAAYVRHVRYFDGTSRQYVTACTAAELLAQQRQAQAGVQSWGWVKALLDRLPRRWLRAGAAIHRLFRPKPLV